MQEKFDKNQIIGFVLIGLILMGWLFYSNKEQEKIQAAQKAEQKMTPKQEDTNTFVKPEIPVPVKLDSSAQARVELIPFTNQHLDIKISTQGAQLREVRLKDWTAYDQENRSHKSPLYLINDSNTDFNISFKDKSGRVINTRDLVFSPSAQGNSAVFTANLGGNTFVQFKYELVNDYSLKFSIATQGLSQITSASNADLSWQQMALALEKGKSQELIYTEFRYSLNDYSQTDYDTNGFAEDTDKLDWISVKQQFFAVVLEAENGFAQAKGTLTPEHDNPEYLKDFSFHSAVPVQNNEINQNYTWNFLPLDYDLLKTFKTADGKSKQFSYNVPYGWTKWLNIFYLWLYQLMAKWGLSAGWIIFLMTIVVKLVTSPIMYKQYIQSAKMRVLKPEIDELNAKNKNADAVKKQQDTMELYRKAGVNPLAGCLPALIQIPIFYSLFRFFPNNIALRGKPFLWADDLTAYDAIYQWSTNIPVISSIYGNHISLFTILYCAVLLIYTRMSTSTMQAPTQEGMPDMRFMMYLMPVMFVFWLNSYASGLSWYYLVSNAINILLIIFIKNVMIDEKKIHAKIQENRAKPVKKQGKWRQKMDNLMKQAQEQQKQMEVQKTKNKKR